jgi:hypothetical protein
MHAAPVAQPANSQSFTFCFAVDLIEGEDHTTDRPAEYNFWRDHVPKLTPPWTGPLLNWTACEPETLAPRKAFFDPNPGAPKAEGLNLWIYRRLADRANFTQGAYRSDITLVNWPHNDYCRCLRRIFPDSVGIGSYRIALHPSAGGTNYIDVSSLPFQIPLSALIPKRIENLIPANKNIGTTHITNGCYRLHPVEWNIGEAAGALAAYAIANKKVPNAIRSDKKTLTAFQNRLTAHGFDLAWPKIHPV